jgi:acetoin utilization deacetylase AcuC-like enzyme
VIQLASHRFGEHVTPPGHPERIERAEVFDAVAESVAAGGGEVLPPRPATPEELARVHTADHLSLVTATAGRAVMLVPVTFTSPESFEIALLAAGGAVDGARLAFERAESTLVLVRPPGHHAEPDRAMGFCLLNNVAVAAAALRADGVARVAIVDFDVHHGNGTQAVFYRDPAVLYVSSHQFPFYPGTGAAAEIGEGAGVGFTVNVPLSAGATDDVYLRAYEDTVVPALERFRPDVLLVSAGYDAHERDPLASMRVTTDGFERLARVLRAAGDRLCGGRAMWVTEGGYHLRALRECLEATVDVLT